MDGERREACKEGCEYDLLKEYCKASQTALSVILRSGKGSPISGCATPILTFKWRMLLFLSVLQLVKGKRLLPRCGEVFIRFSNALWPFGWQSQKYKRKWGHMHIRFVKLSQILHTTPAEWQELVWSNNPLTPNWCILQYDKAVKYTFMLLYAQNSISRILKCKKTSSQVLRNTRLEVAC